MALTKQMGMRTIRRRGEIKNADGTACIEGWIRRKVLLVHCVPQTLDALNGGRRLVQRRVHYQVPCALQYVDPNSDIIYARQRKR